MTKIVTTRGVLIDSVHYGPGVEVAVSESLARSLVLMGKARLAGAEVAAVEPVEETAAAKPKPRKRTPKPKASANK